MKKSVFVCVCLLAEGPVGQPPLMEEVLTGSEGKAWTGQERLRAPGVWGLGMLGTPRVL